MEDAQKYSGLTMRETQQRLTPVQRFEAHHIQPALDRRRANGSIRKLTTYFSDNDSQIIDFSSNDYLGLAQSHQQQKKVEIAYQNLQSPHLGATGSRLLTGDTNFAHALESQISKYHHREAAILCNSGYDANLSVMSCLSFHSTVIMDELSHNSIQMGIRLVKNDCKIRQFRHNDINDLEAILQVEQLIHASTKPMLIVIESVYSMDGDAAPIQQILDLALIHNACVIVDEAHGLGVFGKRGMGLLEDYGLENHPSLLCSIHTFGKAAGCHGAVVCGSKNLKEYLYNYGRPIIYSTSLPIHSLVCIRCSYETMVGEIGQNLRREVHDRVQLFRQLIFENILDGNQQDVTSVESFSPIQALIVPGNDRCQVFCKILWTKSNGSIRLYPIRSPTVPKGQERVRIIMHSHNTREQVYHLVHLIKTTLCEMGLVSSNGNDDIKSLRLESRL